MSPRTALIEAAYLAASILFILGLRSLTVPDRARRGMQLAALGMLVAIVGTLLHHEIVSYEWIAVALVIGTLIGVPLSWVPLTAVPQRTALSHAFGGLAAALVGVCHYYLHGAEHLSHFTMGALGFEVLFGGLTFTGSLMAFGKLQGLISSRNITYPMQNASNIGLFAATVANLRWLWNWEAGPQPPPAGDPNGSPSPVSGGMAPWCPRRTPWRPGRPSGCNPGEVRNRLRGRIWLLCGPAFCHRF